MERIAIRLATRHWSTYTRSYAPAGASTTNSSTHYPRHIDYSLQVRHYRRTSPNEAPKGFLAKVFDNIKSEFSQNKELKESLEKFRQETQKLEETDALKQAREKFKKVEKESVKDVNEVLQSAKDSLKSGVEKAKEAEFVKRTMDIGDKLSSKAKDAAEGLSKQGEYLKETAAFRKINEASQTVGKEISDANMISSLYKPPEVLMTRAERAQMLGSVIQQRDIKPDTESQSVELHKNSRLAETWKKFKDDNPYMNKLFEFKMKYDDSDNPLVRVTRDFMDRVTDSVRGVFKSTEMSEVMTEINKVDPNFDHTAFLQDLEKFVIPTILEAMNQNREDILSDWCHESVFNVLSTPHREAAKLGWQIHTTILDLQNVELSTGKLMEQGPVLIVTFQAHQVIYATDAKGNVMEGNPDEVVNNTYVMAFCRDQSDLDPNTAWRLIDAAMEKSTLMF